MVIKKTIQSRTEASVFAVFESFNGKERQLSRKDRILKVLRSWGSDSEKIGISVRRTCIDDVKNKTATIKDKKKHLSWLRTQTFHDFSRQKDKFTRDIGSLDFTNTSKVSKTVADSNRSSYHKQKFTEITRKYEATNKQSVFRKIFTSVLKKKTSKDELKRKVKLQKSVLNESSRLEADNKTNNFTYIGLQQSFKAQMNIIGERHLGKSGKNTDLDIAFVDVTEQLDEETSDVSLLNICTVADPTDNYDNMSGSLKGNNKLRLDMLKNENESIMLDQTFVKLNRIEKLFESNNTQCRSEDDFMDSFMRSKLYESESDGDC